MTWRLERDAIDIGSQMQGELSAPVWWVGRQWAVTNYGMEARDGGYAIRADTLGDLRGSVDDGVANWPVHMWEKSGVDHDDFMKGFLIALAIHQGAYPALPKGWLASTLDGIERERAEVEEFSRMLKGRGHD